VEFFGGEIKYSMATEVLNERTLRMMGKFFELILTVQLQFLMLQTVSCSVNTPYVTHCALAGMGCGYF
jgi:hypothetical protein